VTLEVDGERAAQATRNLARAGVSARVTQVIGDARQEVKRVPGPIDVLFLDGGFENYHSCFLACREQLRDGALLIADNAGIGATKMADYLDLVRRHCESRTEWFETDLEWNPRDAMEISRYRVAAWTRSAPAP
jgi:predicted O-methyltransferase YrrM